MIVLTHIFYYGYVLFWLLFVLYNYELYKNIRV